MKKIILTLIISISVVPFITFAHPGRTDAYGCHTCRTNCPSWGLSTGEYHCHNVKALPQPKEPIKSIRNENGVGQTVPAPEYKIPKNNYTNTTTSNRVEKPGAVKRFFNWLF